MSRMGELAYAQDMIARIQRGSSIVPRDTRTGDMFRDEGIATTLAHEHDEWLTHTVAVLGTFAKRIGRPFGLDEFRQAWKDLGYSEPHHPNVWGAVTRQASRKGLIRPSGQWAKSTLPNNHSHFYRLWVAA